VNGGSDIGDCDESTTFLKTSYPDDGWPAGMARFDESLTAKQVLDLPGGPFDCGAGPGACALVVDEPYRPSVIGWVPLDYVVPVILDVEIAATGTVSRAGGKATIHGTITASQMTDVHLYGDLSQRIGRKVAQGGFELWVPVPEPGVPTYWEVTISSWNGLAFGSGSAEAQVWADLGDQGQTDGDYDHQIVKLSMPKARR
jgi:hypothetical protein